MSKIELRPVVEKDWESLREIRLRALTEDPEAFGSTLALESAWEKSDWLDQIREVGWVLGFDADNQLLWQVPTNRSMIYRHCG